MTTEEIMKLADAYVEATLDFVTLRGGDRKAARAALEAALTAHEATSEYDKGWLDGYKSAAQAHTTFNEQT